MSITHTMVMMRRTFAHVGLLALVLATSAFRSGGDEAIARGGVFENVVKVLRTKFYDEHTRNAVIPGLAERYRAEALAATSLDGEREAIGRMLSEIPASHLGLLSASTHEQMSRNLAGELAPTFGLELARLEDGFFVFAVLEDGAADKAGIRRGDHVVRIDGEETAHSPRLDWRSDDAALPDPPIHAIIANGEGDPALFAIERTPGKVEQIAVTAEKDSAYEAAKRSAKVVVMNGRPIAYIHFWFIHTRGMDRMLERLIQGDFKDAEALVLDLRGRGGSAEMVTRVLRVLAGRNSKWRKPIVALIDNQTRSAKEMMAYELKTRRLGVLVGQRTAGALLPATFQSVGGDTVLMYPAFTLQTYSDRIEGKGVEPDVEAESPLPYSDGADPIREAGMSQASELAKARAIAKQPVL